MKLQIFGASGSGVTRLGLALSKRLSFTYFDSDEYFWLITDLPFTQRRNTDKRNELILEDLSKVRNWILGGSIVNWGNNLFPPFDLIIFLHLPPDIRIDRIKKREFERYGEAIYKDSERKKLYNQFIAWAKDYD